MSAPLRVAIVGCGAIAQAHAAALAARDDLHCAALFDPVTARAEALRESAATRATVVRSLEEIPALADAAIIATPNAQHAQIARTLLQAGLHVLVEKPLALSATDARALAALAKTHNRVLACGLVRRFYGSSALIKEVLDRQLLGRPLRVTVRESVRNWPFGRAAFDRKLAGGGVFVDMAPHVLDLLAWWLGAVEVVAQQDDAAGGVEAVARTQVRCRGPLGEVPGEILLCRAHGTGSLHRIECERGLLEADPHDTQTVRLVFQAPGTTPLVTEARREVGDAFAAQLADFVDAIRSQRPLRVPPSAAITTVELVERAYALRTPLPSTWAHDEAHGLGELSQARVLVTGASGAVGSRLVEMWAAAGRLPQLRCLVRGYRSAGRILRYPVEVCEGDLRDAAAVLRAAEGCDAIVHLGVGDRAADETRPLVDAAKRLGIRRFVHMSSAAVYGRGMPRRLETAQEDTPLGRTGEPYADAKAEAEALVLRESRALDCVVLRPHMVYGPSLRWSAELVELLQRGRVPTITDGGTCNLIFVDDLVRAVDAALRTTAGLGAAYFITDGAPLPWRDYVAAHARVVGVEPRAVTRAEVSRGPGGARQWLGDSVRPLLPLVRSEEFRRFILDSPAVQATAFPLYLRLRASGRFGGYLRRLRPPARSSAAAPAFDPTWIEMQLSEAALSPRRSERALGFRASVSFAEGLARVTDWCRAFDLLPPA